MRSYLLLLTLVVGLPGCAGWTNPYMSKELINEVFGICRAEMNTPVYFKGRIDDLSPPERFEYCMKSFGFEKKGAL